MSRNGSGSYSLPAGNPVVTGTTISTTWANNTLNDVANAVTQSISQDGQTAITANLPMTGFKHTNVANATARTDYCSAAQAQDNTLDWLTGVAGTDTITASVSVVFAAYVAGQTFRFVSAGANTTTSVTLSINGLGAKSLLRVGGGAIAVGDIQANAIIEIVYDGVQFQIIAAGKQPLDATLTGLAALVIAVNEIPVGSGTDTFTKITVGTASGNLPVVGTKSATQTLAGLVELATTAEAAAGTDDTVVPTIAKIRDAFNSIGTAPVYACRAWANFDGTLVSPISPRASGNVSSITHPAVGQYTVNFTTALPDANYSVVATVGEQGNLGSSNRAATVKNRLAGSFDVEAFACTTGALTDVGCINITVFR